MKFINAHFVEYTPDKFLTFDDVLLLPQASNVSSRNDPNINLSTKFTNKQRMHAPIISANMDTVTGADMVIALAGLGCFGILHRFYPTDEDFYADVQKVLDALGTVAISVGADKQDILKIEKVKNLAQNRPVFVCVDVAHGHLKICVDQVRRIRQAFPEIEIIAGNVCTPQGCVELITAGANAIKVGIGGGSACTTRIVTGHGMPQLSAIMACRKAINHTRSNVALIADGGIRNSGDIVKALAAGADSVMVGNLLAGTDESPGLRYSYDPIADRYYEDVNGKIKKYRGQSSKDFLDDINKNNVTSEGESWFVNIKGSAKTIAADLLGGIRSGLSYCGVFDLDKLSEHAVFIEVTNNTQLENLPHGKLRI